jgi:hypothetical protein
VSDRESGLTSKSAFRSPSKGGKNGRLMKPRPRRTTCCPNVRIATRQQYFQLRTIFWPTECLIDRALYLPRAVLRGENIRTRPRSPLLCPLCRGIGVCFGVRSRPQHGTGDFRRSSRGPRRMEGCGEMRRGQAGLIVSENQHQPRAQQSNDADPLSVGFSTLSTRMQAVCPPGNTPQCSYVVAFLPTERVIGACLLRNRAPR